MVDRDVLWDAWNTQLAFSYDRCFITSQTYLLLSREMIGYFLVPLSRDGEIVSHDGEVSDIFKNTHTDTHTHTNNRIYGAFEEVL